MSYSYIKSVFPNFENSNKVYDETLYNNINTLYTDSTLGIPKPENLDRIKPNYNKSQQDTFELSDTKILKEQPKIEAMSNVFNEYADVSVYKPQQQDNLSYYNLALNPIQKSKTIVIQPKTKGVEQFEEEKPKTSIQTSNKIEGEGVRCIDGDCDQYIKHILECSKCKAIATKQLGIENDRFRNEEMMELASYIIFGLFILLLIDSIKSDKK
jgi:hypothetical protein